MSDIPRIGAVSDDAKESCGKCVYFFNPANAEVGLCRRNPPDVWVTGMQTAMDGSTNPMTSSFHPPMKIGGWCGEYAPRPSVEEVVHSDKGAHVFFDKPLVAFDYDKPLVFDTARAQTDASAFDPGQDSPEPVIVPGGPEKPVTDPGGGGEDGSGH